MSNENALDEFLPELNVRRDNREAHIDPLEIHLEPVAFRAEPAAVNRQPAASDAASRVQLWPMLAAALIGIGVAILALAGFARLGHF